jgi:hypothetical protein
MYYIYFIFMQVRHKLEFHLRRSKHLYYIYFIFMQVRHKPEKETIFIKTNNMKIMFFCAIKETKKIFC